MIRFEPVGATAVDTEFSLKPCGSTLGDPLSLVLAQVLLAVFYLWFGFDAFCQTTLGVTLSRTREATNVALFVEFGVGVVPLMAVAADVLYRRKRWQARSSYLLPMTR